MNSVPFHFDCRELEVLTPFAGRVYEQLGEGVTDVESQIAAFVMQGIAPFFYAMADPQRPPISQGSGVVTTIAAVNPGVRALHLHFEQPLSADLGRTVVLALETLGRPQPSDRNRTTRLIFRMLHEREPTDSEIVQELEAQADMLKGLHLWTGTSAAEAWSILNVAQQHDIRLNDLFTAYDPRHTEVSALGSLGRAPSLDKLSNNGCPLSLSALVGGLLAALDTTEFAVSARTALRERAQKAGPSHVFEAGRPVKGLESFAAREILSLAALRADDGLMGAACRRLMDDLFAHQISFIARGLIKNVDRINLGQAALKLDAASGRRDFNDGRTCFYPAAIERRAQVDTQHGSYAIQVDDHFIQIDRGPSGALHCGAPLVPWMSVTSTREGAWRLERPITLKDLRLFNDAVSAISSVACCIEEEIRYPAPSPGTFGH